ncbi:uncharacterized protein LOC126891771 [Diabrotica virgifera virgifera]|uniref:Uncharacterized protein n=1 Tax=Diabrotica virgifera virgifera TaxID=50390 RepID=A0ABM5L3J1_DIAVI|nr:uncharacterized protein LOC126891771 [Diabrotica virgifera virgifera]
MNITLALTLNDTLDEDLLEENQPEDIPKRDILYLAIRYSLFTLSVLSNSLLLYSYHKLRILKNKHHVLLIHWAAVNLYYFLHQLIVADLVCSTILRLPFSPSFLTALSSTSLILSYFIALAMLLQWTMINFKKYEFLFERYCVYVIYSLGVCIYICEYLYHKYKHIEIAVFCVNTIVLTAIIVNIIIIFRILRKQPGIATYILYAADTIIISLIPMVAYHYLFLLFIDQSSIILDIIFFTRVIPQVILFCHPIMVSLVLYQFSKEFNTAYKVTLRWMFRNRENCNDWIFIDEIDN